MPRVKFTYGDINKPQDIPPPPPPKKKKISQKDVDLLFSSDISCSSDEELPSTLKRKKITTKRNLDKKKVQRIKKKIDKEHLKNQKKPSKENNAHLRRKRLEFLRLILSNTNLDGFKEDFNDPKTKTAYRDLIGDLKYGQYQQMMSKWLIDERAVKTSLENLPVKK